MNTKALDYHFVLIGGIQDILNSHTKSGVLHNITETNCVFQDNRANCKRKKSRTNKILFTIGASFFIRSDHFLFKYQRDQPNCLFIQSFYILNFQRARKIFPI